MTRKRSHPKKEIIPQKLRDEENRLKQQGVKVKGILYNRNGQNKLSQAITTLLSPYKGMDGGTYQSYSTLVAITCVAWNASLVDEPERGEMVNKVINLFKDKTDAKGLLEFNQFSYELIERKLRLFPDDKRFVVKFDVTETKDDYHVFVYSLDNSI
jgi:hypothetical protein